MIYINRETIAEPEVFRSQKIKKLKESAREHFTKLKRTKGKLKFNWDVSWYRKIRSPLNNLFQGKCAYCESHLDNHQGDIELFRPKNRAMNLDGKIDEGYWWLAHEWRNFYLVCEVCNRRYKRNRFPVKKQRAKDIAGLDKEQALLIDPCKAQDFKEQHFKFLAREHGRVVEMVGVTKRGEITVEILGLNRDHLLESRGREWIYFEKLLKQFLKRQSRKAQLLDSIRRSLRGDEPFLAVKRQLVREYAAIDESKEEAFATILEDYKIDIDREVSKVTAEQRHEQKISEQIAYSVLDESKADKERYFSALKDIEKVRIVNFRVLHDFTLDFVRSSGNEEASWLTLIGENATGKSTVLKAIALTLMGEDERQKLHLQPDDYITHGESEAQIHVHLSNINRPITLTITRDPPKFQCSVRDPLVLVLGYGSTRLLRRFSDDAEKERQLIRINNLFNPYQKLNHVEKWLGDKNAVSTSKFNVIRDALMSLLLLDSDTDVIQRRKGRVYVKFNDERYKLEELSDGYQSVLALALDIIRVLIEKWESIQDAEGIVLIDEVGVHLHPRWRMEITPRLMRTFPGLQFIATTHEPLCLRGLGEGQVVLMRRNEDSGEVEAVTGLPSPAEFRVDQLLTSSFFGLNSAMDRETESLFNEYYLLLARKRPNKKQQKRISELKTQLKERRHLGSTPRDQIMYEVIDRLLAQNKYKYLDRQIGEIKEEAVKIIAERWREKFANS